jgi:hypothetical protein
MLKAVMTIRITGVMIERKKIHQLPSLMCAF